MIYLKGLVVGIFEALVASAIWTLVRKAEARHSQASLPPTVCILFFSSFALACLLFFFAFTT
jgi:hypothetical protein